MADTAIAVAIRERIADRLRGITKAAGYRTDIGLDVHTEPRKLTGITAPRCVVHPGHKQLPQDTRVRTEREYRPIVEVVVPATLTSPYLEAEAAEADIEDALRDYVLLPNALPAQIEESVILDRPDGLAFVVLQVLLSTRYRQR